MRMWIVGLRPRLLIALVLTSAVTLGFAALSLFAPLESRLRADGTNFVLAAVNSSLPAFDSAETDRGKLNKPELIHLVRGLEHQTAARVAVLTMSHGRLVRVVDTDPDLPDSFADARLVLAGAPRTFHTIHSLSNGDLSVAAPLTIAGQRYVLAVRRRLAFVSGATRVVRDVFLKAAGVGLIVALLLGIGLATTLLRRLERLRNATRQVDAEGIDAPILVDRSHDEIGDLARSFAGMQTRLRQQEEARQAFVATASHELRTPLASLDGMLELLDDDLRADHLDIEDARERIARAKEQSRRLASLAADLLDLSRLDAEVELRTEPVELGELCRAVVAEFDLRVSDSGVQLAVVPAEDPSDEHPWALADPGSVARIVRILIDNALRVAPPGSRVEVRVTGGRRWTAIEVRDYGPGVSDEERQVIFERFQRGSSRRGEVGFGLGLAIGRELAQRMGGSLELQADRTPGASFVVRLPAAKLVTSDER